MEKVGGDPLCGNGKGLFPPNILFPDAVWLRGGRHRKSLGGVPGVVVWGRWQGCPCLSARAPGVLGVTSEPGPGWKDESVGHACRGEAAGRAGRDSAPGGNP